MIDIARHPLLKEAFEVCEAIEACGASVELTAAVTKASALMHSINSLLDKKLPNEAMQQLHARDARTIVNAFAVADHAARSDIELYARCFYDDLGPVYDTTRFQDIGGSPDDLAVIDRALKYIELRGDVWPWSLKRQIDAPHLVRFVEKKKA